MLTIHRSKGLEFPVVYCPYLWEPGYIPRGEQPVVFHDPDDGDARTIDVGARRARVPGATSASTIDEQRGEDLRLAYVALTRATHQAVVWWAGSCDSRDSPLGAAAVRARRRRQRGRRAGTRDADATTTAVAALRGARGRGAGLHRASSARAARPAARRGRARRGGAGRAGRGAASTARWTRAGGARPTATSPPARTRRGWRASPRRPCVDDEPPTPAGRARGRPATTRLRAVPSLLADMPAGGAGRHVRAPRARGDRLRRGRPRRRAGRAGRRRRRPRRRGRRRRPRRRSSAGCARRIETPLGPLAGGLRLRDLARADRLDELAFELPLVGGDEPTGALDARRDRRRAATRTSPPATRWRGYADRLADPALRRDRARLPDRQHRPRRCGSATGDALRGRRLQDELARRRPARR